jgi:hypothetical protein
MVARRLKMIEVINMIITIAMMASKCNKLIVTVAIE